MKKIKNSLWYVCGMILLGISFVGVVLPGLPFSPFLVGSAICFSKGSPAMHAWLYNHKFFGPFLSNWISAKVFPTKLKYAMLWTMLISLGIMWAANIPPKSLIISAICMLLVAIWAWRFPGSLAEYYRRESCGERIGWFKQNKDKY